MVQFLKQAGLSCYTLVVSPVYVMKWWTVQTPTVLTPSPNEFLGLAPATLGRCMEVIPQINLVSPTKAWRTQM